MLKAYLCRHKAIISSSPWLRRPTVANPKALPKTWAQFGGHWKDIAWRSKKFSTFRSPTLSTFLASAPLRHQQRQQLPLRPSAWRRLDNDCRILWPFGLSKLRWPNVPTKRSFVSWSHQYSHHEVKGDFLDTKQEPMATGQPFAMKNM